MCSNLQRLTREMKKKPTRDFFFHFAEREGLNT